MIGFWASATTKLQVKSCRSPGLSVRVCPPYVGMGAPLAAKSSWLVCSLRPGTSFLENTQRSEPVTTKNLRLLTLSVMNRRPVDVEQVPVAAVSLPVVGAWWCAP